MESLVSVSVSIITSESDFIVLLDGAQPAHSKHVRSMQIVEFFATPGSHVLSIEEKRAYKSRFWWLPAPIRHAIQSVAHERGLVDEKGIAPQYLSYRGEFNTDKTIQLDFVQEDSKLVLLHGDIREEFNEAHFDTKWRGRLAQYLMLPALALSAPLALLSVAMHIYAAAVGKTLASVVFAVAGTVAVSFAVLQAARIKRTVNRLTQQYCGKRQNRSPNQTAHTNERLNRTVEHAGKAVEK